MQPVLWMHHAALAQVFQPQTPPTVSAPPLSPTPVGDPEVMRAERPVLSTSAVPPPPTDEPLDPDKYVCGNGDILELNFWGVQNFRLRVTIDLEGRAFVAKVGYFTLRGKTLTQARQLMRASVARYYPRLNFDVTLAEPRSFLVQVVDDVVHPGSYAARAIDRVAAIIARAGGFGPNASKRRVEITRRDGSTARADLLIYMLTGDVAYNPYLLDGDVVRIPFEELAATVSGAVNRSGRFELTGSRDLAELVSLAGGLAPNVTKRLPITIVRRSKEDRVDMRVVDFAPDGGIPAVAIAQDDAVRIPTLDELQQSVTVVGAIAGAIAPEPNAARRLTPDEGTTTRRLPYVKGDTVRLLLERLGGVGPLADLTGSYLIRSGQAIAIDLYALVILRDFRADRPIQLGDTLVIPFKRRNILVEGAVFAPGPYPYNPAYTVEQYLALAGGRNRFAQSLEDVRVIMPSGDTKEYQPGLKVDPGSSLVVPERNFSRSEVVQIVLGAAGILLSGVAVMIAARK